MSVKQPDVIDFVARDPKTGDALLVMVEVRDWNSSPIAAQQLDTKLAAYSEFILSGALARQFPEAANRPVRIQLDHFWPITDAAGTKLREWAAKLAGIPVSVWSNRRYWNPLLKFFCTVAARFGGSRPGLVRWLPESNSRLLLLTSARFAAEFCDALLLAVPDHRVQIMKDLEIKVVDPTGRESGGFLDNSYEHYKSAPERKADIIQKYVAGLLETRTVVDCQIDTTRIIPVIKDRAWIAGIDAGMEARGKEKTLENVHDIYNSELIVMYAEDSPRNIRYLTPSDLGALKLAVADLRRLSVENLKRLLPEPEIRNLNGIYQVTAGGNYEASLLLLDSFWRSEKMRVNGEIVAAIPARDCLLVTGSADAGGLAKIARMAQGILAQAPYRISSKLFVFRNGAFEVFDQRRDEVQ